MIPKLVELQFKATEKEPEDRMEVDPVQDRTCSVKGERYTLELSQRLFL